MRLYIPTKRDQRILIPAVADICKKYTSPVTKGPITLMAGGGMFDGRSLAAALMLGAHGIWVGTRFVTAKESEAPRPAKDRYAIPPGIEGDIFSDED